MNNKINSPVPFDPGFSKFFPVIDSGITVQIDSILKLKALNQIKFQLQLLENKLYKPMVIRSAIYYGCVIYGSVIACKYKNPSERIEDNPFYDLPLEKKEALDLTMDPKYTIEIYHKLHKNIPYYLKRKSKLSSKFEEYADLYIEFMLLNDHFKGIQLTDQISLPEKVRYFQNYSNNKLTEIETRIFEIIEHGNLEEVFNIS